MLVTEEVSIRVSSSNKQHYLDSGYDMPLVWSVSNQRFVVPKDTFITVKVEDLLKGSCSRIKYICDYCGEIKEVFFTKYINKKMEEDICCKCYMTIYRRGDNHPITHQTGDKNPNWNPNLTDEERRSGRADAGYSRFVMNVMKRDNYTCQITGQCNGKLGVHHIFSYKRYPELRIDESNGITLSKQIHREFHSRYGISRFTPDDFYEFSREMKESINAN